MNFELKARFVTSTYIYNFELLSVVMVLNWKNSKFEIFIIWLSKFIFMTCTHGAFIQIISKIINPNSQYFNIKYFYVEPIDFMYKNITFFLLDMCRNRRFTHSSDKWISYYCYNYNLKQKLNSTVSFDLSIGITYLSERHINKSKVMRLCVLVTVSWIDAKTIRNENKNNLFLPNVVNISILDDISKLNKSYKSTNLRFSLHLYLTSLWSI